MKKNISLLFIFFYYISFSQNKNEILDKIKNHANQDTVRVELLVDACVSGTFDSDKEILKYATEALKISNKINYQLGKVRATNCVGNYYFQRGDFKKSIRLYFDALNLSEKRKDTNNIIISKSNIANVYTRTRDHQKAIQLLKECDQMYLNSNGQTTKNRAALLTNLATVYSNIDKHDLAIKTYLQVLDISNKINSVFGQAITYANLGNEYLKIKQINLALDYSQKALTIIEKNNIDFLKTEIYKILGVVYLEKKQFQNAILNLKKAEKISKSIEDNETLVEIYGNLKKAYLETNDYKNAYLISELFLEMKEKVFSLETKKNADELSTKYETEKKESQIKQLTQEKQISDLKSERKTLFLYSSILGFSGILLSFYFFFRRFKTNKQNELLREQLVASEAQKQANESELKALKSQMNPHFIFNALNSIQEQFMYGDKLIANEQMENFTTLTRQILSVSGKKKISLTTEIDILTRYLELEKMRFDSDFFYTLKTNEDIDEEYTKIPPMLIQPFVENSIKHGLLHKDGIKKLDILFQYADSQNYLIAEIIDNGIGRKKSEEIKSNNKHNSFSTSSIAQRLQLLNNNENADDIIIYEDLIDVKEEVIGTKVTLKINLNF